MKESIDVEKKTSSNACLFVGQIPRNTTEDSLREHFETFGAVSSIKMLKDRAARPFAFVQFVDDASAEGALESASGSTMNGRQIRVEKARINCTLFVAKLARTMSTGSLRDMFEAYGPVESVSLLKDHQTQRSKGCGFVKFVDRDDAQTAFNSLKANPTGIVVEWAVSKNDSDAPGVDKCNIFVGGLNPQLVEEDALRERFSAYGELESVTLVNRHAAAAIIEEAEDTKDGEEPRTAKRSAFAFLRYTEQDSSATAIECENGTDWLDRRIRVQYCESQEMKNKRRAAKGMPLSTYGAPGMAGNMANGGMFYPVPGPLNQNGMIMMGGVAWYGPPVYPGMDMPLPYNAAPYGAAYPPYGAWAFPGPYGSYSPEGDYPAPYLVEGPDASTMPTNTAGGW